MSSLALYLVAVNIVSFIAFTVDYLLCCRIPNLEESRANAILMDLFPIAGGAIGSLLALFVWSGRIHKHRINKSNIAWWFLCFLCLVIWAVVVLLVTGSVEVDPNAVLGSWNLAALKILAIYLLFINAITFVVFVVDKKVAENGNSYSKRVPEARLLGLCLIGGSVGGLTGMYAVRHKTKKWYFTLGLPIFIVLHVALAIMVHAAGLI
ncbi:MAG: hypothetical protein PEGG_00726 [Paraeggerthella hongkongensis]